MNTVEQRQKKAGSPSNAKMFFVVLVSVCLFIACGKKAEVGQNQAGSANGSPSTDGNGSRRTPQSISQEMGAQSATDQANGQQANVSAGYPAGYNDPRNSSLQNNNPSAVGENAVQQTAGELAAGQQAGSVDLQKGAHHKPAVSAPAKSIPVEKRCFELVFSHAVLNSHQDSEACAHHKNVVHMPKDAVGINEKSLCVRVDGKPVAFRKRENEGTELVLDPIGKYTAKITVSYCLGADSCTQKCDIPKDEFMAALGANADAVNDEVVWNTKAGKAEIQLDDSVKRELVQLEDSETQKGMKLFAGWSAGVPQPHCRK